MLVVTNICVIMHYLQLIPHGCEILTGRGACHSGGLRNFRSQNDMLCYDNIC